MRIFFAQHEWRQQTHQLKKVRGKVIEDLMNCDLTLLFIDIVEIEGVLRDTKCDPKNGNKCPGIVRSCHKTLRNMKRRSSNPNI